MSGLVTSWREGSHAVFVSGASPIHPPRAGACVQAHPGRTELRVQSTRCDGNHDVWRHVRLDEAMSAHRRSFTIRFEDQATHDLLALLAGRLGVSMNHLAETMIKNEIGDLTLALQEDLSHTLARLAGYRGASARDVARFAAAEVAYHDPLQARMVAPREDLHDIARTFAAAEGVR